MKKRNDRTMGLLVGYGEDRKKLINQIIEIVSDRFFPRPDLLQRCRFLCPLEYEFHYFPSPEFLSPVVR